MQSCLSNPALRSSLRMVMIARTETDAEQAKLG